MTTRFFCLFQASFSRFRFPHPVHHNTAYPSSSQAAHQFSFVSSIPISEYLRHTRLCQPKNNQNLENTRPDIPQSTEEPTSTYPRDQASRSSFNAERRIFFRLHRCICLSVRFLFILHRPARNLDTIASAPETSEDTY